MNLLDVIHTVLSMNCSRVSNCFLGISRTILKRVLSVDDYLNLWLLVDLISFRRSSHHAKHVLVMKVFMEEGGRRP